MTESRLQQRDHIFIMDGEAQRHVRLTPPPVDRGGDFASGRARKNSCGLLRPGKLTKLHGGEEERVTNDPKESNDRLPTR